MRVANAYSLLQRKKLFLVYCVLQTKTPQFRVGLSTKFVLKVPLSFYSYRRYIKEIAGEQGTAASKRERHIKPLVQCLQCVNTSGKARNPFKLFDT